MSLRARLLSALALTALCLPVSAAAAAAAAAPGWPAAPGSPAGALDRLPGRVIVKYASGTPVAAVRSAAAERGARVVRQVRTFGLKTKARLEVVSSATLTTGELLRSYAHDPQVMYAEPDYRVWACGSVLPDDPLFSGLWGLQTIGAPYAWSTSTGSGDVVVADIDTGAFYTHPDLAANMWHNPGEIPGNGLDDDHNGFVDDVYGIDAAYGDSDPLDFNGHGTHTAGTMAAVGDNGVGVAGVCWTARIMALQFLDESGGGWTSDAVTCINYMIAEKLEYGMNVVAANNSWGGADYSQTLHDAIEAAGKAGIVFVCAASNDASDNDTTPMYPASYDCSNIISVAATDASDSLAWFSNWGVSSVDIAAPGVGILSTVTPGWNTSGYAVANGTSMATPHVTGAIALMAAAYPNETMAQRIGKLLRAADPLPALAGKVVSGGRLDVYKALDRTPPTTTVSGVPEGWATSDVRVVLSAADDASGVAATYYSVDGGPATAYATPIVVSAQGVTDISAYSVDEPGNAEAPTVTEVRIDKTPPSTSALRNVTTSVNRKAIFAFRIRALTPTARARLSIYAHGRLKKQLDLGSVATNADRLVTWKRCSLPPGAYTWKVEATDEAGLRATRTGLKKLIVR